MIKKQEFMKQIHGVIFDADGTLIDSMHLWENVDERYLLSKGIKPRENLMEALFSLSFEEGIEYLQKNYLPEEDFEQIAMGIRNLVADDYRCRVELKSWVKDFLEELSKRGIPMYIATSGEKEVLLPALERNGIAHYFKGIATCKEVGAGKEQPDIYLYAASQIGTKVSETLVVEDALHGAKTAKKAGFPLAVIRDLYSESRQYALMELADLYLEDFSELIPVRLNKYLSEIGYCSRREADRLIAQGVVLVDGNKAVTGEKIYTDSDVVVAGEKVKPETEKVVLAFYKPRGIECTTSKKTENNIVDYLGYDKRIYPVGRLDKDSEGLILMTNRGELVNHILKASNYHEKEYEVLIDRPVDEQFVKKMSEGVRIEKTENKNGKKELVFEAVTRPCIVKKTGSHSFRITITQGLNRQIRRMCQVCGAKVISLKRIRIMNLTLGELQPGEYRMVTGEELHDLINQA